MAFLPAETFGLDDSDALDADLVQRLLHFIKLEGLDDGLDLFHPTDLPKPRRGYVRMHEHNPCQPNGAKILPGCRRTLPRTGASRKAMLNF
jgi:hypothetical protein